MEKERKFNYIIFHGGCLDGFSGFFIAQYSGKLTEDVIIYEDAPSTNRIPPNIDGKDIIIIDVAYKREILEEIFKYAKSVVFIDHHISIRDDVSKLSEIYNNKDKNIKIIYNEDRCGSTLTWGYFFGIMEIPLFLKYIEDQDTGTWQYPNTKPFIYALKVYYKLNTDSVTLVKWGKLMKRENVSKLIKKGMYMKKYNDYIVNMNLPKHTLERFPSKKIYNMNEKLFTQPGQYKVAVFCGHNCPSVTDLGTKTLEIMPEIDFCILWVYNLDSKKYILSMRSRIVDVASICKIFNGGGHTLAAACSFLSSKMKIDDLFYGSSMPRLI